RDWHILQVSPTTSMDDRSGWPDILWMKSGIQKRQFVHSIVVSSRIISSPSTNRYRFCSRSCCPHSFTVFIRSSTPCRAWSSHQEILRCMGYSRMIAY
ncbi:hypothetical protein PFISCL1PPCAC_2273, partial [Pristionchus fissidentatus]